jgi:hypothetical protein
VVIEVDDDLLSLRDPARGRTDIRLDPAPKLLLRVFAEAVAPGCTPPLPSGGFRGRMLAAEANATHYSVCVRGMTEPLEGRIVVGFDHLDVVADEGAITVPFAMIVWVSSSRRPALR